MHLQESPEFLSRMGYLSAEQLQAELAVVAYRLVESCEQICRLARYSQQLRLHSSWY